MAVTDDFGSYTQGMLTRLRALVSRLRELGYRFERPDSVLPGPGPDVQQQIERVETLVGPIPAALAQFYRTVGSVDLAGFHPNWVGCEYPDPLIVEPIESALEEAREYAALDDPKSEYSASESGVFRVPIAPDALHKAHVSGGMWYGVEIPNALADPVVLEEPHGLPFTRHLELSLSWGGFPGLADTPEHSWPLAALRRAAGAT